jgi:hypothetical protein
MRGFSQPLTGAATKTDGHAERTVLAQNAAEQNQDVARLLVMRAKAAPRAPVDPVEQAVPMDPIPVGVPPMPGWRLQRLTVLPQGFQETRRQKGRAPQAYQ